MGAALQQRTVDRHPGLVYGPVSSRRFGTSLGVNLLPGHLKLCNFDCVYCQCGPTEARRRLAAHPQFPTLEEIEQALVAALADATGIGDICFSGDGEPTIHPRFRDAVLLARRMRDRFAPHASVTVLSNGTRLAKRDVWAGLMLADRRVIKIDAAIDALFRRLDRPPPGVRIADIIERVAMMVGVETQTMLVRGDVDNATDESIDALGVALRRIRPAAAQLMTLSRRPSSAGVEPVDARDLANAAERLRRAVPGLVVRVY